MGIKVVLVEPGRFKTDIWTRNVLVSRGATAESSPNRDRGRKYADEVKQSTRKLADPIEVAQLITRIAQDPNPRLRYRVGRDAKTAYLMKHLIPWKIWEGMLEKKTGIG